MSKNDFNLFDDLINEIASSIRSNEFMSIVDFAKEVVFNNDPEFELYPTQRAILKAFYNEKLTDEEMGILREWREEDRTTWVQDRKYINLVLEAGRRGSKALCLETELPTPSGKKKFGDIKPGDYVFNPQGKPIKVLAETEVFTDHKLYRLFFSDGSYIDCDAGHLWLTDDKSSRKAKARAKNPIALPRVRTTEEIVRTLKVHRNDGRVENNHSISLSSPLQYNTKQLPIHPYCLGLFLGDGFYQSGMITSSKEDIDFVRAKFAEYGYDTYLVNNQYPYRFKSNRLNKELKEVGLWMRQDKFVPEIYITSSLEQRLDLIRGLMDSDGSCDSRGHTSFTNTNFQLTDAIYELATSLGCVVSFSEYLGKYNGKECKAYREIRFRPEYNPFYLPRKAHKFKSVTQQNNKRFIVAAKEIDSKPVKCITVEGSLFLVGNNIITHNCNAASALINTTIGRISFEELYQHYVIRSRVGILTYDPKFFEPKIVYDYKMEPNGNHPVIEVQTGSNKKELTTREHPYFVWRLGEEEPRWIEAKDLAVGDYVMTAACTPIFGETSLHKTQAADLTDALLKVKATKAERFAALQLFRRLDKESLHTVLCNIARRLQCMTPSYVCPHSLNLSKVTYLLDDLVSAFLKFGIGTITNGVLENNRLGFSAHNLEKILSIFKTEFLTNTNAIRNKNPNNTQGKKYDYDKYLCRPLVEAINQHTTTATKVGVETRVEECLRVMTIYELHHLKKYTSPYIQWEPIIKAKRYTAVPTYALEVPVTNIIGNDIITHNSTLGSIIALKEFHDLITLDNPAKHYKLLPNSPIAILVIGQSEKQVKETIFAAIKGYAENSSYFQTMQRAGIIEILGTEIRCPSKNVAIYAKHTNTSGLVGYSIKALILDEVARFETNEEGDNKAFEVMDNVGKGGAAFETEYKSIAISSAWENGDPIEQMFNNAKSDLQSLAFKLTTFQLNLRLKKGVTPKVVSDYALNYIKSRLEYEGIRYSKHNSLILRENLERNKIGFSVIDALPQDIDISMPSGEIKKYAGVKIDRIEAADHTIRSFVHVDPALKKDSAALALVSPRRLLSMEGQETWKIAVDGLLKWEPSVDQIGHRRMVSFIDIENKLDNIIPARRVVKVTFDQWNSASFIQRLIMKGVDAQEVSSSREAQFTYYTLFRDLVAHDFIIMPADSRWSNEAITELSELIMKPNRQIIHPFAGKDLADAIVNAVYQCYQHMVNTGLTQAFGLKVSGARSKNLSKLQGGRSVKIKVGTAIERLHSYNRK